MNDRAYPWFGVLILLAGCQPAPVRMVAASQAIQALQAPSPIMAPPRIMPSVPLPERRVLLTIRFDLGSYTISRDSFPVLYNLSSAMKDPRLSGASYEINGHTDLRGNLANNIALSGLRAKSVVAFLRSSGVQEPAIRAQGFGPLQPLDPASPYDPENRRVEIVAIGP